MNRCNVLIIVYVCSLKPALVSISSNGSGTDSLQLVETGLIVTFLQFVT